MVAALSKPAVTVADLDRTPVRVVRLLRLGLASGVAFAAWKIQWRLGLGKFFTGPGSISRILLLFFVLSNWKNMPGVWTYRIWHAIIYHCFIRKSPKLGPRALFRPMITETHAPLTEIDYNMHKSNSTYFSDLDIARTHLVTHLLRPGLRRLTHNTQTGLVLDEETGRARRGRMGIMLGAVHCSFRREISGYRGYEMWSRVLAWDRKWLYMVTHFVPRGVARPTEYLDVKFGALRTRKGKAAGKDSTGSGTNETADAGAAWEKKIHATAVSKYVFKLGRFTVHPSYILEASEVLPARPGGWRSGPNAVGDEDVDLDDVADDGTWDWKMVEKRRRAGMEFAQQFANLDTLEKWFDGGDGGDGSALGRFGLSAAAW
ncbi:hypothetical protein SODALDRAFT_198163 [Sodiomyces alkalinus F11]|uniref:Capsule polysaccharide biosynthesis protein n=1 Tax=Sodiomyces alkalinus (strain CBS 110278 / VKM F-3762 / F11) TaxID=1314773 RepID=A0A3N2PSL9_SODAK|nr:hypothetical protein SODALDRAFT_198163 [Sodiomyces alkalinus F11]ROT37480.1 hypothetical protein SODALDRAFT_198163 [Sodiomyces alkalinus F11]